MSSRARKLDKQLLASQNYLDSDDQDALVTRLSTENFQSFKTYNRLLAYLIVVELPVLLLVTSRMDSALGPRLLLILSNLLSLVNILYKVTAVKVHLIDYLHKRNVNSTTVWVVDFVFTFTGVNIVNLVLNVQLWLRAWALEGVLRLVYLVPSFNLVFLVLVNKWFTDVKHDIKGLHGMRYKFKSV